MVKTKWHRGQGCKKIWQKWYYAFSHKKTSEYNWTNETDFWVGDCNAWFVKNVIQATQKEFWKYLLQNSNPFLTLCPLSTHKMV